MRKKQLQCQEVYPSWKLLPSIGQLEVILKHMKWSANGVADFFCESWGGEV